MELIYRFAEIWLRFYIFIMPRLVSLGWILMLFCLFVLFIVGVTEGEESQNINKNNKGGE